MSEENQDNMGIFTPEKDQDSKKAKAKVKPGFCPKCGAYVGAFYSCKWCGTTMPHGKRLRAFQLISVIGIIIGLIALGVYAQTDPAPTVQIGDIGPTYANATVTINGEITGIDYYEADDDSWKILILTVNDGTGSIDVKAYSEVVDGLILHGGDNTPAIGDNCSIRGGIYVKGDDLHLMLESYLFLKISREIEFPTDGSSYNATDFVGIYSSHLNERVNITGEVGEVNTDDSYFILNTTAGVENIKVSVPNYVKIFNPEMTLNVLTGQIVTVAGICGEYKVGGPQIVPSSLKDIRGVA